MPEASVLVEGGREELPSHGAPAEKELREVQGLGPAAEGGPADQRRAHLRELALGRVRVPLEQDARDKEAQDGIPQELQALVAERQAVFVGERGMTEGLLQKPSVLEAVTQRLLDPFQVSPGEPGDIPPL